jgi:transcriptional regulator with XRE-family HTH domain
MTKLINNLPYLIKAYRKANDLTQKELADLVGIDHTMISRIESNADTQRIDLGTAEKFRKVLNFNPNELIKLVDE